MAVASVSLYHFTNSLERLKGILKNGFVPRYVLEEQIFGGRSFSIGIPMVCFCDIPLSQIKDHLKKYGNYGIGLSKDWAAKNGLNPVIYTRRNSTLSANLRRLIAAMPTISGSHATSLGNQFLYDFEHILFHAKPYQGTMARTGSARIRFYDEREWRFVPFDPSRTRAIALSAQDYAAVGRRAKANKALQQYTLNFDPEDIKYVFVAENHEIPRIIRSLKLRFRRTPVSVVDLLISRILTISQIKADF